MEIKIWKQTIPGNMTQWGAECKDKNGKFITVLTGDKEVTIGRLILENPELFKIKICT